MSALPRRHMRHGGPIPQTATVRSDLARHRRWSPPQLARDTPQRHSLRNPARDLLTFRKRQTPRRPLRRRHRPLPPRRHDMGPDRRRRPTQPAANRPQRLTQFEPIPDLRPLRPRQSPHHSPPRETQQLSSKVMQRPPEITADMGGSLARFHVSERRNPVPEPHAPTT